MKIALVTGGSRGLGKSMALAIADKGRDVILTFNSKEEEAQEVVKAIEAKGCKAVALQLDVSKSAGYGEFAARVQKALGETWGVEKFDFLINNAGIGINAPFMETSEEQVDQLVDIIFKSAFFLSQKMLPMMNDGGRIVNISSGLARFCGPGYSAYGAMKGAVEVLSRYMAKELGPRGITVNAVAPGAIETDFGGGRARDNKQYNDTIASQTALGRVGVPDDIGPMVASLLSDDNRWINAQRIEVSGGMSL